MVNIPRQPPTGAATRFAQVLGGAAVPGRVEQTLAPESAAGAPGANVVGSSLSTNPLQATKFDSGKLVELLGAAAIGIGGSDTVGGRLGGLALEGRRRERFSSALAKGLAGEDLTADDLRGLGVEETTALVAQSEQVRAGRLAERQLEIEQTAQEAQTEIQRLSAIREIADVLPDEAVGPLAARLGFGEISTGVDFVSRLDARLSEIGAAGKEERLSIGARGKEDIAAIKKRGEEERKNITARFKAEKSLEELKVGSKDKDKFDERVAAAFRVLNPLITGGIINTGADLTAYTRLALSYFGDDIKGAPATGDDYLYADLDVGEGSVLPGVLAPATIVDIRDKLKAENVDNETIGQILLQLTVAKAQAGTSADSLVK